MLDSLFRHDAILQHWDETLPMNLQCINRVLRVTRWGWYIVKPHMCIMAINGALRQCAGLKGVMNAGGILTTWIQVSGGPGQQGE